MRRGARVEERQRGHPESGLVDADVPGPFLVVDDVPTRFAVVRDDGVQEHHGVDAFGDAVGDCGDDDAAEFIVRDVFP